MPYNHPIPDAPIAPSMLPRVAAADLTSQDVLVLTQPGNNPGQKNKSLELGTLLGSDINKASLNPYIKEITAGSLALSKNFAGDISLDPSSPTLMFTIPDVRPGEICLLNMWVANLTEGNTNGELSVSVTSTYDNGPAPSYSSTSLTVEATHTIENPARFTEVFEHPDVLSAPQFSRVPIEGEAEPCNRTITITALRLFDASTALRWRVLLESIKFLWADYTPDRVISSYTP